MKNISVSLIISTYNNERALNEILCRILGGSILPDNIHVADDGSGVRTQEVLEKDKFANFSKIHHHWHEDLGFRKCKILNQALSFICDDYIIFLDGDCLPHKHFIKDHIKLAEIGYFVQGRRCFIHECDVESVITGKKSINQLIFSGKIKGYFKSLRFPRPIVIRNKAQRGLIGCNWSAWRNDLIKVNGFDEDYEGWGIGEDSDICTRLYNLGISRKFVYGRSIVYHLNHEVINKSHLKSSNDRLQETISLRKTRCINGITKG